MAILACLAALAVPGATAAGPLYSLDPRIGARASVTGPAAPTGSSGVFLPAELLDHELLYYATVTATSSPAIVFGVTGVPVVVRARHVGGRLVLARSRGAVGDRDRPAGSTVVSWPAETTPEGTQVTLEAAFETSTMAGTSYESERPFAVQDVAIEAGVLAFTQRYRLSPRSDVRSGDPEEVEVALRVVLLRRTPSSAPPRPYTRGEAAEVGLLSLGFYEGGFSGVGQPGDLVLRPDPSRTLRYYLHPTIPPRYRDPVREGVLAWAGAVESVPGHVSIEVVDGEDPAILPGDPEYVVLYWHGPEVPKFFQGLAQPLVDPRNGEIFAGQILVSEQQLLGTGLAQARVDALLSPASRVVPDPARDRLVLGGQVTPPVAALVEAGMDLMLFAGTDPADREFDRTLVRRVVVHEVGHTLGLQHNFRGSADLDRIPAGSSTTTAMDYLPPALAPDAPGPYDRMALVRAQGTVAGTAGEDDFAYGGNVEQLVDPDANAFDVGEPVESGIRFHRRLRRLAPSVPELQDPDRYRRTVQLQLQPLFKVLLHAGDARLEGAARYLVGLLDDRGADPAPGGGCEGALECPPSADWSRAKNLVDRLAVMEGVRQVGRLGTLAPDAAAKLVEALASTAIDADRTDLFLARAMALETLGQLEDAAVPSALDSVAAGLGPAGAGEEDPGPTGRQDRWLAGRLEQIRHAVTGPAVGADPTPEELAGPGGADPGSGDAAGEGLEPPPDPMED